MTTSARTFRVFVSSTFSDLKAERNALQERVFPRLLDLAATRGCRFQAIDLRWGVSEEAALDQQTMKICLGEIDRCQKISPRPNFIVLLGNRYGWRPLPSEIPADEFEQIVALASVEENALLEQWYRRDDNAIPPTYCLQPRNGGFIEYEHWGKVENDLRQVFLAAIKKLSLSLDDLIKYTTSATEQEIIEGAFRVVSHDHIFCFAREMDVVPQDSNAKDYIDLDNWEPDTQAAQQLLDLKHRLKDILGENYHEYTSRWEETAPSMEHLDKLCEDVYRELEQIILKEAAALEQIDPLDKEITSHQAFGQERSRQFLGRTEILKQIDGYLLSNNPQPLVVWGSSGSGKSALIAKAAKEAKKSLPQSNILQRFIGATPDSSNGRTLLESLCRQVTRLYGEVESTLPSSYDELEIEFQQRLGFATAECPLVLFLDALDQLSDADTAASLTWLPAELPVHVRLVVTTLPGECLETLDKKIPIENRLELLPMSLNDGQALLNAWLDEAGRKLQTGQRADIIEKYECCGLPLYLKLAFEEARRWRSFDGLPKGADGIPGLGKDIPGILRDLFWRLSQESNHGELLVGRSLGYLAAAKNGLSEDEMLKVLSADTDVLKDFRRRSPKSPGFSQLPVVVWSRLYFDLEPYLVERAADGTTLMTFYHPSTFGKAVTEKYLTGDKKTEHHRKLAAYFESQPLEIDDKGKSQINLRKTSELVFQQWNGEKWQALYTTLTDFSFLECRCRGASVNELEDDYRLALQGWQGNGRQVITAIAERLRLESHHIRAYPELLFPHLYNHLTWLDRDSDGPLHSMCEAAWQSRSDCLRMVQDPHPLPPLSLRSYEGPGEVRCLAVLPDERTALISSDRDLMLWDLQKGKLLHSITGHVERIRCIAVSPDGRTALSAADNLRLWDLESGRLIRSFEEKSAMSIIFSPDGKTALTGSSEGVKIWMLESGRMVRIIREEEYSPLLWAISLTLDGRTLVTGVQKTVNIRDLRTGRLTAALDGHSGAITTIAVTPDGSRAASGSQDKSIILWDISTGKLLRKMEGHLGEITSLQVSPDGTRLLSSAKDGTLRHWNLLSGELVSTIQAHKTGDHRFSIKTAFLFGGQMALSAASDGTMKVWNLQDGSLVRTIEGHVSTGGIVLTSDGSAVLSGSRDQVLKLWDLEDGHLIRSFAGETGNINAVAISPDQKVVFSASGKGGNSILKERVWHTEFLPYNAIKAWEMDTGRLIGSMEGHASGINAISVGPDGKTILSGSDDNTVGLWDLDEGRIIHSFIGHTARVLCTAVNYDGSRGISGSMDTSVKVWDIPSRQPVYTLEGHRGGVLCVAAAPDGKTLCSGSADTTLKIWNLQEGICLQTLTGHAGVVNTVTFSHDGTHILSGSDDCSLKLWDASSGKLLRSFEGTAGKTIRRVAFRPDGKTAVSASGGGELLMWNLDDEGTLCSLDGHSANVPGIAISDKCRAAISVSSDHTIRMWELETGKLHKTLENRTGEGKGEYHAVKVFGNGKYALSCSDILKVWSLESGKLLNSMRSWESADYLCAAVASDGRTAICGEMGRLEVWDLDTEEHQELIDVDTHQEGPTHVISAVWISPDGRHGLSGGNMDPTMFWDLENLRLLSTFEMEEGEMPGTTDICLLSDGQSALCAEHMLTSYDTATGNFLDIVSPGNRVGHFVYLPERGQVIIVSRRETESSSTLKQVDLATGEARALMGIDCPISSLAISDNKRWIACGDSVGRVWIFEWAEGLSKGDLALPEAGAPIRESIPAVEETSVYELQEEGIRLLARDPAEALRCFEKAIQARPADLELLTYRATALVKMKKFHQAVEAMDEIIQRGLASGGNLGNIYAGKGNALIGMGDAAGALESYGQALTLEPKNANIWYMQGTVLFGLEHFEDALNSFARSKALQANLNTEKYLGHCCFSLRRYQEAETHFAGIVSNGKADAIVYFNLAMTKKALGKKADARACLEKFMETATAEQQSLMSKAKKLLEELKNDGFGD